MPVECSAGTKGKGLFPGGARVVTMRCGGTDSMVLSVGLLKTVLGAGS
jgi:hypothetical protein